MKALDKPEVKFINWVQTIEQPFAKYAIDPSKRQKRAGTVRQSRTQALFLRILL